MPKHDFNLKDYISIAKEAKKLLDNYKNEMLAAGKRDAKNHKSSGKPIPVAEARNILHERMRKGQIKQTEADKVHNSFRIPFLNFYNSKIKKNLNSLTNEINRLRFSSIPEPDITAPFRTPRENAQIQSIIKRRHPRAAGTDIILLANKLSLWNSLELLRFNMVITKWSPLRQWLPAVEKQPKVPPILIGSGRSFAYEKGKKKQKWDITSPINMNIPPPFKIKIGEMEISIIPWYQGADERYKKSVIGIEITSDLP